MSNTPFEYEPELRRYSDEEIAYAKWALETGQDTGNGDGSLILRPHPELTVIATPDIVAKYRKVVEQGDKPFMVQS